MAELGEPKGVCSGRVVPEDDLDIGLHGALLVARGAAATLARGAPLGLRLDVPARAERLDRLRVDSELLAHLAQRGPHVRVEAIAHALLGADQLVVDEEELVRVDQADSQVIVRVLAVVEVEAAELPFVEERRDDLLDVDAVSVVSEVDEDLRVLTELEARARRPCPSPGCRYGRRRARRTCTL